MATFLQVPSFPVTESATPRVNRTRIGTYEQRVAFGLNPMRERWDLRFGSRGTIEAQSIISFLQNQAGTTPFTWNTPFGEIGQFVCDSWTPAMDSCGLNTVTANFELTYVPGVTNLTRPSVPGGAFTFVPSFSSQRQTETEPKVVRFGDGYAQRLRMGMNVSSVEWDLSFNTRSATERNGIRAFLRGCAGIVAFPWTDPINGLLGKYVCDTWSIEYRSVMDSNIRATFRLVYEP